MLTIHSLLQIRSEPSAPERLGDVILRIIGVAGPVRDDPAFREKIRRELRVGFDYDVANKIVFMITRNQNLGRVRLERFRVEPILKEYFPVTWAANEKAFREAVSRIRTFPSESASRAMRRNYGERDQEFHSLSDAVSSVLEELRTNGGQTTFMLASKSCTDLPSIERRALLLARAEVTGHLRMAPLELASVVKRVKRYYLTEPSEPQRNLFDAFLSEVKRLPTARP